MKVFNLEVRDAKAQKAVFESSRADIYALNQSTLQSLSLVMTILGAGVFLLSLLMPAFYDVRAIYGMGFAAALSVLMLSHRRLSTSLGVLLALYLLFGMLFALAMCLSLITAPTQRATVLLGFIPLMPLLIIDRPWRVNAFVLFIVMVHAGLSLFIKPWDIPLDDFVNCLIFALLGIYVGSKVRATRLTNFTLQHETEKLAKQDFLTGLYNRRKMYDAIGESEAGKRVIHGALLFDIDHFKGFNDHYGHQAGDACLVRISAFLEQFARANNMAVFRFGGEEFMAFQYEGGARQLAALAEAIRAGIYECNIAYVNQALGRVSISVVFYASSAAPTPHGALATVPLRQQLRPAFLAQYSAWSAAEEA